jgi:hypothetical protein
MVSLFCIPAFLGFTAFPRSLFGTENRVSFVFLLLYHILFISFPCIFFSRLGCLKIITDDRPVLQTAFLGVSFMLRYDRSLLHHSRVFSSVSALSLTHYQHAFEPKVRQVQRTNRFSNHAASSLLAVGHVLPKNVQVDLWRTISTVRFLDDLPLL